MAIQSSDVRCKVFSSLYWSDLYFLYERSDTLRNDGSACGSARKYAIDQGSGLYYRYAIHEHKEDAFACSGRLLVGRTIADRRGIEHSDVRVGSHANSALIQEHRCAF